VIKIRGGRGGNGDDRKTPACDRGSHDDYNLKKCVPDPDACSKDPKPKECQTLEPIPKLDLLPDDGKTPLGEDDDGDTDTGDTDTDDNDDRGRDGDLNLMKSMELNLTIQELQNLWSHVPAVLYIQSKK
jgi:hypothetical protein